MVDFSRMVDDEFPQDIGNKEGHEEGMTQKVEAHLLIQSPSFKLQLCLHRFKTWTLSFDQQARDSLSDPSRRNLKFEKEHANGGTMANIHIKGTFPATVDISLLI